MREECSLCGAQIRKITTSEGEIIPLDLSIPVYRQIVGGQHVGNMSSVIPRWILDDKAYVSHFDTCNKMNRAKP